MTVCTRIRNGTLLHSDKEHQSYIIVEFHAQHYGHVKKRVPGHVTLSRDNNITWLPPTSQLR